MANTPLEVHTEWGGNELPSSNITDAWTGVQKVFKEL